MATVVEQRSQSHMGGMGYDQFRYAPQAAPQFTNPWGSQHVPNTTQSQMYSNPMQAPTAPHDYPPPQRTPTTTMAYPPNPAPAPALPQDVMQQSRPYPATYPAQAPPAQSYPPTSTPRYSPEQYAYNYDQPRPSLYNMKSARTDRDGFSELDAGQGMVQMSQDITPRNIYGRNGSHDSYGFPTPHSQHSSISSSSGYPSYYSGSYNSSYSGSVDGSSVTDYSSASEDAMGSRTLPAPGQMVNGFPPEPGTMMSQFNSKLAPSAQKKHKCKICDKRFTRPSSLQTHMYSHTGEKPFVCDHEGCGRHFSVVSNLRRHKKVHKNGAENSSPEED